MHTQSSARHRRMGQPDSSEVEEVAADLDLSVVVPVYNSAGTLEALLQRIARMAEGVVDSYEIILVDDDSQDDSWAKMISLREAYRDHLVAVQLMRNYGQHNALMCGLGLARGRLIVTMDDDLQNPPEEIPRMTIKRITSKPESASEKCCRTDSLMKGSSK